MITPEQHRRIMTEIRLYKQTENLKQTFKEYSTTVQKDEKSLDIDEVYMTIDILRQMEKTKKDLDEMYNLLFKLNDYRKVKDHHATPLS